jgi:hypothetical protein
MLTMATEDEVVEAFNAIDKAWENYRATLRSYLAEGLAEGASGRQASISRRLGRTREMLRRDAMTDEQREQLRIAEAERKRAAAAAKKAADKLNDPTEF